MTLFDVSILGLLMISMALNGVLAWSLTRMLNDLMQTRQALWQQHLELAFFRQGQIDYSESGEVAKQPPTEDRMTRLKQEGNVVFLDNTGQEED